jgi:hypothetical protein
MITANNAKNRLLRENPEKDIETFSENNIILSSLEE